jgi:hypothetical protein
MINAGRRVAGTLGGGRKMAQPLTQKLQLKAGQKIRLVNSPGELKLDLPSDEKAEAFLLFARDQAELRKFAPKLLKGVSKEALVWIAYPKKTGSIRGSDLDRDHGWDPVIAAGYGGVRLVAIDDTWSAMRFRFGAK